MLKKALALALCLCVLLPFACASAEGNPELLQTFVLRYGDRNSRKIAITVDDCYKSACMAATVWPPTRCSKPSSTPTTPPNRL